MGGAVPSDAASVNKRLTISLLEVERGRDKVSTALRFQSDELPPIFASTTPTAPRTLLPIARAVAMCVNIPRADSTDFPRI